LKICLNRVALLAAVLWASSPAWPAAAASPKQWDLLEPLCGNCHNSTDWAGGIAFDAMSPASIHADADVWEEVIRKLRGRLMPPPGEEQPSQKTVDSLVSWLEGTLDKAAAANPDPGYVGLHRLNRTEYAGEIRRVLDMAVDVKALLPKDVSNEGFDNIAATLRISPSFLDQYIAAARIVSRQAIGRATGKATSSEYRPDSSTDQSKHVDGLPLGTRGGFVVEHDFAADGEYVFSIRQFLFMGAGYVTKVDDTHKVILTIDGKRVFQEQFGGPEDLKYVDQQQAIAADDMQNRFNNIRVKVKAGVRRVGVAFIQRSFAQSDSPLQPIAELPEMERVPGIPGLTVSGPFNVSGVSETPSRRKIFSCMPRSPSEEMPCAVEILGTLASEAFRRPATEADLRAPLDFYVRAREYQDFEAGIESGLTAILSSTKFLLRSAPTMAEDKAGKLEALTDLELATRLAFFLWSAGPDQTLVELAVAGKLRDSAVLDAQVRRLLKDPRSESLVTNFAFQWLNVGRMDNIKVDPMTFPTFDANLRAGFQQEIRMFLDSVLRSDRSALDLLRSDTTFLNERLARQYGVLNVQGDQLRAVKLADPNRWGLLGKGALLMATSYANRTSPVLRGAWVLDTLIGTPPSPPPPGVEQFKENEPGKKLATVRERLEEHRAQKSCNSCHGVIDPLGFALENYDVTGAWRDRDRDAGTAIDAAGRLASGTLVKSPRDLSLALLARPDQFIQTLTEKLMIYALGRPLRAHDMPAVRAIVRQAAKEDYRFEALVKGVVASDAFRLRRLPEVPAGDVHVTQIPSRR
jgi:mono/diheme cytochrome c family protein